MIHRIVCLLPALTILGCSGNFTAPPSADGVSLPADGSQPQQPDAGVQPKPDSRPPLQSSCDPLLDGTCPAGQRCGLNAAGAARCYYTTSSDTPPGNTCGASGDGDTCVDSHVCLSAVSATMCAKICNAQTYKGCSRSESCNAPINTTYNGCTPSCDLLSSNGCPTNGTCGVFSDPQGGGVYKGCATYGTRTQGQSCSSSSLCARNHSCVYWSKPPYTSGWTCRQHCDLDGKVGPTCPSGTSCSSPPNELEPFGSIDRAGVCR